MEEKTVSLKDIVKVLLGNKFLYLILAAAFCVASLIGLNVISSRSKEYVAYFDYNVAGFETVKDEETEEEWIQYIDGEKFDLRSLVIKEKVLKYFSETEELKNLDGIALYNNNVIKSFTYEVTYKQDYLNSTEKETTYMEDEKGYKIILNASQLERYQAKALVEAIANEVINITDDKIDKLSYVKFLNYYDSAKSYYDKINKLVSGINYIDGLMYDLIENYGDVVISSGNYGGTDNKYYVDAQKISDYQNKMNVNFNNYYFDSLKDELDVAGYLDESSNEYIISIETAVKNLERQIVVDESVVTELKAQRESLIASAGTVVETLEISEYNSEIIELTKKIADEKEQVAKYQLQLDKLDIASLNDEERATYNNNLAIFEKKIALIRTDLEFYTSQCTEIAKSIMKKNMYVFYHTSDVVSKTGGMGTIVIAAGSIGIGLIAPMLVNIAIAGYRIAEGKSLLIKKTKEEK